MNKLRFFAYWKCLLFLAFAGTASAQPREGVPTLSGYIEGWQTSTPYTFARFFWNTFLIIAPKVIGTAISCTMVAYGFARFEFPGKKILFVLLIATLLLPNVVTRIPQYLLFRDIGWLDTFLPLWVPSALAGDAFFVFMLIQFLRAIPRDMEEAARVVATRPIPAEEMEKLAADFFPDPAWPPVDRLLVVDEDFWPAFSGRPVPAGLTYARTVSGSL